MNPAQRFSDRLDDYIKYRPGYPPVLVDLLKSRLTLPDSSVIADIGSGTGKLTQLFLEAGYLVYGIEPNDDMRRASESLLSQHQKFNSIAGMAEETHLAAGSIDLIVAGQAFHWFEIDKTRQEFLRILKPNGRVALVWNRRRIDAGSFLQAYDQLLEEHCPEYKVIREEIVNQDSISRFFGEKRYEESRINNRQIFTFTSLVGRLRSSSYVPLEGPNSARLLKELERLFHQHKANETVIFDYDTVVIYGYL